MKKTVTTYIQSAHCLILWHHCTIILLILIIIIIINLWIYCVNKILQELIDIRFPGVFHEWEGYTLMERTFLTYLILQQPENPPVLFLGVACSPGTRFVG